LHALRQYSLAVDLPVVFLNLAIAVGLGLLVGLQRERASGHLAGFRTFPLVALLGAMAGLLAQTLGGWVVAAGFAALAGVVVAGNFLAPHEDRDPGITTEVALLLIYGVGVYLTAGSREVAIAVGASVAVLLQFKERLHGLARRLTDEDLRAMMQFALVALVILPALPDRAYGPYEVLNPHRIWLMVVLIVGISLGGYVAYKVFGSGAGVALGGVLGGLISSTATTVSYARRVARTPDALGAAVVVIMIASATVFARLLLELAVAAPGHVRAMAPPLAVMLAALAALAGAAWYWYRKSAGEAPPQDDPTELKSALVFGLLYAVVLFTVAAVKARFGTAGLFVVAGLSGLTDVDAITLSTAQLVRDGGLDETAGWRLVLVAATSNLVFKAAAAGALGGRRLFAAVGALYAAAAVVAALLLLFWPAVA
jgi:uncharacterized membrane protein (DUF4010 family)